MLGRDLRSRLPVWAPAALVLAIAAAGLLRVLTQHWREGAALLGGALLVAAALRAVFPDDRVGMLVIRSRMIDLLCYCGFGLVTILLAMTITRGAVTFV